MKLSECMWSNMLGLLQCLGSFIETSGLHQGFIGTSALHWSIRAASGQYQSNSRATSEQHKDNRDNWTYSITVFSSSIDTKDLLIGLGIDGKTLWASKTFSLWRRNCNIKLLLLQMRPLTLGLKCLTTEGLLYLAVHLISATFSTPAYIFYMPATKIFNDSSRRISHRLVNSCFVFAVNHHRIL